MEKETKKKLLKKVLTFLFQGGKIKNSSPISGKYLLP